MWKLPNADNATEPKKRVNKSGVIRGLTTEVSQKLQNRRLSTPRGRRIGLNWQRWPADGQKAPEFLIIKELLMSA